MIFIALFHYLCPLDSALDLQGSLSQAVLRLVMEEVNREVNKAEAQQKKMVPVPLIQVCSTNRVCALQTW